MTKTQFAGPISCLEHRATRVLHCAIVTRADVLMFPLLLQAIISNVMRPRRLRGIKEKNRCLQRRQVYWWGRFLPLSQHGLFKLLSRQRDVVVNGVGLVNENSVNQHRARFCTWIGDYLRRGKPSRCVVSKLGADQLRLKRQWHGSYRSLINTWVAGNTVRSLTTRAIPQRFCGEVAS